MTNASNLRNDGSVFGASFCLPPLIDRGGKLVWSTDEKVTLFYAQFGAKQCRDAFQQPQSCDPSSVLCSVAFRSSFVCSLLLDLDPYGGNDPDGMFPLCYKRVTLEVPKLTVIFRHWLRWVVFRHAGD